MNSEEIEIIGRDELRRLKQELQDLKEYGGEVIGEYEKQKEELQERIDKAIEYIKLKWSYEKLDEVGRNDVIGETGKTIYEDILREEDTKKVLEILKGEDKE